MTHREQQRGLSDEWYTPACVFEAMGATFDVDVAYPPAGALPWIPAREAIRPPADGLTAEWRGFAWMNPPFGGRNGLIPWLDRFIFHGDGVALTPDRTSAPWWQAAARRVDLILFVSPKIRFVTPDGAANRTPAQGTSLMAIGERGRAALVHAQAAGFGRLMRPA